MLVIIWEYYGRAILWIPKWLGLDGFQIYLHHCALDESSLSTGRDNKDVCVCACVCAFRGCNMPYIISQCFNIWVMYTNVKDNELSQNIIRGVRLSVQKWLNYRNGFPLSVKWEKKTKCVLLLNVSQLVHMWAVVCLDQKKKSVVSLAQILSFDFMNQWNCLVFFLVGAGLSQILLSSCISFYFILIWTVNVDFQW